MRYSYILPRFILLTAIWGFFYFAFDPILKWSLEKSIGKAVKAEVEINILDTSFLPPKLYMAEVKIGDGKDEYKNLLEFAEMKFEIQAAPLLKKKFIINEASLSGLKFGTKRTRKLKTSEVKTPKFVKKLGYVSGAMGKAGLQNIKSGAKKKFEINPESLESVIFAKNLSKKHEAEYDALMKRADIKTYNTRLSELKAEYKSAKKQKNFLKKMKKLKKVAKKANRLSKDFKKNKNAIEKSLKSFKEDLKKIEELKNLDTKNLMGKMNMPALDNDSISKMLLAPAMTDKIEKAWKWTTLAKKYIPENPKKKLLKNKTQRGRIVHFPKLKKRPNFLIKEMLISGELKLDKPLAYKGTAKGITTQPFIYGKPMTIRIDGKTESAILKVLCSVDATKEVSESNFKINYSGIPVKKMELGSKESFGVSLRNGTGDFRGDFKIKGKALSGNATFKIKNAALKANAENIKFAPLKSSIEKSISSVSDISADIKVKGKLNSPEFSFKTDLADKISAAFKSALGDEVQKAKKEAERKVAEALKPYRAKIDNLINTRQNQIKKELKASQKSISDFAKKSIK